MSAKVLFVFEGERTEDIIVRSLEKHILSKGNLVVKCAFGAEVYQLYQEVKGDEDLDTFELIKNRNANKETLKDYNRSDFAEIYLFFDYDAHARLASSSIDLFGHQTKEGDEKLKDLLRFFDNETEKGKLYISYPMVEALKHIKDYETFHELVVRCKGINCSYRADCDEKVECADSPHYKAIVDTENIPQLRNIGDYTEEIWKNLITTHLSKMNCIVNGRYEFPQKIECQKDIFEKQLEKHISKKCPVVSVLSAFPVFVHDYYGNEETRKLILL